MKPTSIVELAVEVTEGQWKGIIAFLRMRKIPFYAEPARQIPFVTLDEVEAACEGK